MVRRVRRTSTSKRSIIAWLDDATRNAALLLSESLMVTRYYMITRGKDSGDLGANYFDELSKEMVERHALKRPERLRFQVELKLSCLLPVE
jgi:hypothetical protein